MDTSADPLNALGWLVGNWTADGETPDGNPETSEVTYQWASHRKAIQYALVRKSGGKVAPALTGICGWHPGKKQFVLWEMDGEGNLTEGSFTVGETSNHHEEVIYGVDGSALPVRVEVVRQSDDTFVFNASVEKDGRWVVVFQRTYARVKP